MVLDVCPPLPSPTEVLRSARRPHRGLGGPWLGPRRLTLDGTTQALFGIVQGGTDAALRGESAERTVDLDFDGYAVGGLSVGEDAGQMLRHARRHRSPTSRPTSPAT